MSVFSRFSKLLERRWLLRESSRALRHSVTWRPLSKGSTETNPRIFIGNLKTARTRFKFLILMSELCVSDDIQSRFDTDDPVASRYYPALILSVFNIAVPCCNAHWSSDPWWACLCVDESRQWHVLTDMNHISEEVPIALAWVCWTLLSSLRRTVSWAALPPDNIALFRWDLIESRWSDWIIRFGWPVWPVGSREAAFILHLPQLLFLHLAVCVVGLHSVSLVNCCWNFGCEFFVFGERSEVEDNFSMLGYV